MTRPIGQARLRFLFWGLFDTLAIVACGIAGLILLAVVMETVGLPAVGRRGVVLLSLVSIAGWGIYRSATLFKAFWGRRRIARLIETKHPEYQDLLTTEDYLTENADEAAKLGFSPQLMDAVRREVATLPEPQWNRLGLDVSTHRSLGIAGAAVVLGAAAVWFAAPPALKESAFRIFASGDHSAADALNGLRLAEEVEVPLHRSLSIPAAPGQPNLIATGGLPTGRTEFLLRGVSGEWKPFGAVTLDDNGQLVGEPISFVVTGETRVVALSDDRRSNVARILPVYPPAVTSMSAGIRPPEYTGWEPDFSAAPTRIDGISGSHVALVWDTNNNLTAAHLEVYSETGEQISSQPSEILSDKRTAKEMNLVGRGSIRLRMKDRFDQENLSPAIPFSAAEDGPPNVRILSPSREVVLGETLQAPLSVMIADDVAVSKAWLVSRLDNGVSTAPEIRELVYSVDVTQIRSATTVLVSPLLDATQLEMWPGDQVAYWIESEDWRGPDRPGTIGRSEVYTARYPTVEEVMDDRAEMTSESVDGLESLLEEQQEIARQFQEMRRDIQSSQSAEDKAQRKFETEQRLQETVERQAAVQDQLNEMADDFNESLKRLEENNDISLRTLQKFERVQELLDEVLSQEAKDILRELQETLKKMQENQLRPEELDQTELTLDEFEKQLDRQLELLENMWLEQNVEALQEQAEELAELQEELQKASQELHNEKNPEDPLTDEEVDAEETPLDPQTMEEQLAKLAEELKEKLAQEAAQKEPGAESSEMKDASAEQQSEQTAESPESDEKSPEAEKQESANSESTEKSPEGEQQESADSESAEKSPEQQAAAEKEQAAETAQAEQEKAEADQQKQADAEAKPEEETAEGLKEKEEEQQTADAGEEQEQQQEASEETPPTGEQEKLLADRQEQLNKETEALLEELKRLREEAEQKQSPMSESLSQMAQSEACESVSEQQQQASKELRENKPANAAKKQSQAKKSLQQMADALAGCCAGGDKDMEDAIAKMKEILERAFLLSVEGEQNDQALALYRGMPQWPNPDRMSRLGREMGFFRQEANRLSTEYKTVSEKNPFADFTVVKHFDQAARNWRENTQEMEEAQPSTISLRAHQSLGRVNLAIERLLESIDQSQSQSSSSGGMEGYFRGLKEALSEQRKLNNQTEKMKEQMEGNQNKGEQGQPEQSGQSKSSQSMQEQMQRMAEQQRNVRRQIEQLEQQYQQMKQRAGGLEGVSESMQEVEQALDQGRADEEVTAAQKKIEQRLLDAERSLHEKGYKRKRKALSAEGEPVDGTAPEETVPITPEEEEELARLLQDNLREVSPHWRNRVREYYDELLKTTP